MASNVRSRGVGFAPLALLAFATLASVAAALWLQFSPYIGAH